MTTTGTDLSWIMYVGVGIGVLLVGIGVLWGMLALAKTLGRVDVTLDELDRQISTLSKPVNTTLDHVGGIADTADQTLARLGGVVKSLEDVAGSVSQTASLTKDALAPAIINAGATITGVSAGLRRLVKGRKSAGES